MGMLAIFSFVGFTSLVALIAWWATRGTNEKSADGFYLGGRSLGAVTIAGSLLLTNLSAEQIVGLNGQAFTEGILVMAWETLAAIALVLTAVFLLPKYMKGGITTIPQFIESRFDTRQNPFYPFYFCSPMASFCFRLFCIPVRWPLARCSTFRTFWGSARRRPFICASGVLES